MSAAGATKPRMSAEQLEACRSLTAQAPSDGAELCLVRAQVLDDLVHDAGVAHALHAILNTPELIDFAKGVHLEAAHQEQRWGSADRKSKSPYEWFWLLSHLATRALEHHKEAERLGMGREGEDGFCGHLPSIAHHREKAAHHTITAAGVLAHWHAGVVGKHTAMQPGHSESASLAAELLGERAC